MIFVLLLFFAAFSGCENSEGETSSHVEVSSTPMPDASSDLPSSESPESPAVDSSEEFEPDNVTSSFQDIFGTNPIDTALEEDLGTASSSRAIFKAYDTAATRWKVMIQVAYSAAKNLKTDSELEALEKEQEDWSNSIESELENLRQENVDDSDGTIKTARMTMEKYRERAENLCQTVYEETEELPEFDTAMNNEAMG